MGMPRAAREAINREEATMSLRHRPAAVAAALLAASLVLPAGASAFQAFPLPLASADGAAGGIAFSAEAELGSLGGTAYERVYDGSFKLSQLDWDIKGVAAAGLRGSVGFARGFSVNLGLWAALTEGNGMMVDRDWLLASADTDDEWTHESRHPDTSVDEATLVDLNVAWRALELGGAGISAILGYKSQTFKWTARGGTYIYSDLENGGYRDQRGRFPDRPVIEYEQKYTVPYVGVAVDGTWGALSVEGHLAVGPSASATDRDYHVLRDTLFEGDFSGGSYAELGVRGTYFFTPRFFASVGIEAQAYEEMRGDITITAPDAAGVSRDGGSVEIATAMLTLGAGLRF